MRLIVFSFVAFIGLSRLSADEPQRPTKPLFRDFIGINGHTVSFKPELYSPVCRLVRDYHPMEWDTGKDSNYKLDFPFARNRVNWEQVYGSWKNHGFKTDACIMFETLQADQWNDIPKDAYLYGKRFAESFGPSAKLPLVEAVEIGNEPGKYDDATYRKVFENMSRGFRDGDPKLLVATCNVNVGKSGDYHKSVQCVEGLNSSYDVLNIHSYAMLEPWPTWKRSYPEDPALAAFMQDIDALIRWRDVHAQGKQVWLTEFGWDASTQSPASEGDFAKWQGNDDVQQAQWLVRSFFLFATRDLQRAYIYFFNDEDEAKFHASSGLTRSFKPKPSYFAVSHLHKTLADYRFSRIVQGGVGEPHVYEFLHESEASQAIWVAWMPTGDSQTKKLLLSLENHRLLGVEEMPLNSLPVDSRMMPLVEGKIDIEVKETPIYLFLKRDF